MGRYRLGICLMKEGQYETAEKHFLKALEMKNSPWVQAALAELFLERGDVNQALSYAENMLARPRTDRASNIKLEIHFVLARAFFEKKDWQSAERHWRKASRLTTLGYGIPAKRGNMIKWLKFHGPIILEAAQGRKEKGR